MKFRRFSDIPLVFKVGLPPAFALLMLTIVATSGSWSEQRQTRVLVSIIGDDTLQNQLTKDAGDIAAANGALYLLMTQQAAGGSVADSQKSLAAVLGRIDAIKANLITLRPRLPMGQRASFDGLVADLTTYRGGIEVVGSMLGIDFNAATSFIRPFQVLYRKMRATLTAASQQVAATTLNRANISTTQASRLVELTIIFAVATLLLVAAVAWVIILAVRRTVTDISQATENLAQGHNELDLDRLERCDEFGAIIRSLTVFRENQLRIVRAEEELRRAKEHAEKSDQAKSEFLANMSHELRTPLNSILGTVRLLQETNVNLNQQDLCDTVLASSMALLALVNDILDLSKISAGALELEQIGFDPVHALSGVINRLEPLARERKLVLSLADNPPLPYLIGDPTRLVRIFTNLISNAIKYTASGGVRVVTTQRPLDEGRITYRCEVIDSGIGIPAHKHASIFEKFTQADASTTRKYGGTGLGLAITKQLVELMGGTIGVVSTEGQGSTFWFEIGFAVTKSLHREKGSARAVVTFSAIPAADARVLIAEDHPMNQLLIRRLMNRFGIDKFKIAGDGVEAVDSYEAGAWDIILMDCHMPEKNGYDATVDIRAIEKATGRPRVPIIAMTANAMVGDREECLRGGMDEYISKPIVIEELVRLMGQWIEFDKVEKGGPVIAPVLASCIDLAQLRSFTDDDKEMERDLIRVFVDQSDINVAALMSNQADGIAPEWVEAAHMLKGGAAGIGAEVLRGLCEAAQTMENADGEERTVVFHRIALAYADVKDALRDESLLA